LVVKKAKKPEWWVNKDPKPPLATEVVHKINKPLIEE
jgi:hypothetical protein